MQDWQRIVEMFGGTRVAKVTGSLGIPVLAPIGLALRVGDEHTGDAR